MPLQLPLGISGSTRDDSGVVLCVTQDHKKRVYSRWNLQGLVLLCKTDQNASYAKLRAVPPGTYFLFSHMISYCCAYFSTVMHRSPSEKMTFRASASPPPLLPVFFQGSHHTLVCFYDTDSREKTHLSQKNKTRAESNP